MPLRPGSLVGVYIILICIVYSIPISAESYNIGVYGSAPFVKTSSTVPGQSNQKWSGISIDLWREIARRAGFNYNLQEISDIDAGLKSVENGELDLLIGPISVTRERAELVDFSHPYYEARTGILSRSTATALLDIIRQFISTGFPIALLSLLLTLFTVGLIFWSVEHKHNKGLSNRFWPGVGKSMWFAMVTFVTVGYGEITPRTITGRIVTAGWMLMSLLIASSITAIMATTFTLQSIKTATVENRQDLKNRPVAVVQGTTGAKFARSSAAITVEVKSIKDAIQQLKEERVLAVTHDYPILHYHLQQNPSANLKLFESHTRSESYAFAIQKNHPVRRKINLELLEIMESPQLKHIFERHGL